MKMQVINPLNHSSWDDRLASSGDQSFFHSAGWAKTLQESYGYQPVYFTQFHGDRLTGLLPVMDVNSIITGHRGVSLPFTDYCDPMVPRSIRFPDIFGQVIEYGKQRGWKYIEIRSGQDLFPSEPVFARYFGHILNLSRDQKEMLRSFRNSTVRNIKKASQRNIEIQISDSLDSLKSFYELNCATRKRHGLPPQPYRFFEAVYENVISKGKGILFLAYYQNELVTANVYFHFGKMAIYKYGASNMEFQNLRANNLVMWKAVNWYSDHGYSQLCLGRTETDNIGLRQFKTGWGVQEYLIKYYRYDLSRHKFLAGPLDVSKNYAHIFSRLPTSLLKIMGSIAYRHMG